MKICMIFPTYPPNYQADGIGDYTRILVEKLRDKGQKVSVISSGRYAGKDPDVIKVGGGRWSLKELVKTYRLIRDAKFDVVHMQYTPVTYGFGPVYKLLPVLVKAALPRTVFVTTFHTLVGGPWITRAYAVILSLFSDRLISTNEEITGLFNRWIPYFRPKIDQIPIGANVKNVDVDRSRARRGLERKYGLRKNAVILSNFGFTNPGKGFEDIIDAMSLLGENDRYYLLLVGALRDEDAAYRHRLNGLIRMKGLERNVIWAGEADDHRISSLLKGSDIYIIPYTEGLCTRRGSLMAGINHSLPVISTAPRNELPLFKDRENIMLVKRNDPASLADAIKELSADEELRNRIASKIGELEKTFNWDTIAERTIDVYKKAAAGTGRAGTPG
ncbi:MAG: glycosyltransferase [Candidatus Omnitrophica bacterium]|nr:glycosyltransferase [Candidatus Omnitrophota bacterium]